MFVYTGVSEWWFNAVSATVYTGNDSINCIAKSTFINQYCFELNCIHPRKYLHTHIIQTLGKMMPPQASDFHDEEMRKCMALYRYIISLTMISQNRESQELKSIIGLFYSYCETF